MFSISSSAGEFHSFDPPWRGPAAAPDALDTKELFLELKSTKDPFLTDSESEDCPPSGMTAHTLTAASTSSKEQTPSFREIFPEVLIPEMLRFSDLKGAANFFNSSKRFKRSESEDCPPAGMTAHTLTAASTSSKEQTPAFRENFPEVLIPEILRFSDLKGAANFLNSSKRFKSQELTFARKLARDYKLPEEITFRTVNDVVSFSETIHALAAMHFPDIPTPPDVLTSYDSSIQYLLGVKNKKHLIHQANRWGQPKAVQHLLQLKCMPREQALDEAFLRSAAEGGNLEIFKTVLQRIPRGQDLDKGILFWAVKGGNLEIFKTVLQRIPRGQDLDKDVLCRAARGGNLEIFKAALQRTYRRQPIDKDVLRSALEGGNLEIFKTVLDWIPGWETPFEGILLAARGGFLEIFKTALQRIPRWQDLDEKVLRSAAEGGNLEIFKTVLQRIPLWQPIDKDVLRSALEGGNLEIFKTSLQLIPRLKTPIRGFLWDAARGGNLEIFKTVLECIPQEQALDEGILWDAARGGNLEIFKNVLQRIPTTVSLERKFASLVDVHIGVPWSSPKMVLGVKRLLDQRQRERESSDSA